MDYSALANEVGVEMNKVFKMYNLYLKITLNGLLYGYDKYVYKKLPMQIEEVVICALKCCTLTGVELSYPEEIHEVTYYNEIPDNKVFTATNSDGIVSTYYYDAKGNLQKVYYDSSKQQWIGILVKDPTSVVFDDYVTYSDETVELPKYLQIYYILIIIAGEYQLIERVWRNTLRDFAYFANATVQLFTDKEKAEQALLEAVAKPVETQGDITIFKIKLKAGTWYRDEEDNVYELWFDENSNKYIGKKVEEVPEGEQTIIDYSSVTETPSMGQTYYYWEHPWNYDAHQNENINHFDATHGEKVWQNDFQDKVRSKLGYKLMTDSTEAEAYFDSHPVGASSTDTAVNVKFSSTGKVNLVYYYAYDVFNKVY